MSERTSRAVLRILFQDSRACFWPLSVMNSSQLTASINARAPDSTSLNLATNDGYEIILKPANSIKKHYM